ncbi:MAG: helix-turn-helix domain-containing protein [Actinomycetota bacterium]
MPAGRWPAAEFVRTVFPGWATAEVAEKLGVDRKTVYRWVTEGVRWGDTKADSMALEHGRHPADIWPGWWDIYLEPDEDEEPPPLGQVCLFDLAA